MQLFGRGSDGSRRRLYAVGDVGFCGHLTSDTIDPWTEVGGVLRRGDAVFANLETPLVSGPTSSPFVGPRSAARRLAEGGLSVINLANNHITDAGADGLVSTLDALDEHGIAAVGAGRDAASARRLVVTDLGGLKVGWLGCARTLQDQPPGPAFWELDREELLAAVRRYRSEVDVLVVSIHFGYMYVDYPHPDHRRLTHEVVEAGAGLVLAHHAHVVQGIETVGDRAAICHNLGNFLFDWTVGEVVVDLMVEEQRRGAIVAVDLDRHGVRGLTVLPTRVDDDWVVRWATGEIGSAILSRLVRISRDLTGDYAPEFRRQRAERNTGLALRTIAHRLRRGDLRVIGETLRQIRWRHVAMLFRWLARRGRR